ncbi:MAG: translation initiation factor IF-2 [Candidatus Sumerlaeia bacterium]
MRVSDLAKLVNATSKEVIQELEALGYPNKKHMSTVDEDVATQVIVIFDQRKLELRAAKEEEERKQREADEQKRREEELRQRREEEERRRKEEEERRILEQQRREEEEARRRREEEERLKIQAEALATPGPEVEAVETTPSVETPPAAAPVEPARPEKKKRKKKGAEEPLVVPQIEVMKMDKPRRRKGGKGAKQLDTERKKFKPTKLFTDEDLYVTKPIRTKKARQKTDERSAPSKHAAPEQASKVVSIKGDVTVGQFAERVGVSPMEIIKKLMQEGVMLTINQILPPDWCELLAAEYNIELELTTESDEQDVEPYRQSPKAENMAPRPPVVTIMGHVDHGKTTLLDYIRNSRVAEQEFGAITQHIGAYHVETPRGPITFLDTPGHEAFTSMRARGVQLTDIVILVVAANDGVMPQTVEAINHTKSANVPIIVAINKIDLPDANPRRVRQELMQYGLVGEDLGGDTIMCEVSAKKGINIDQLLELTLLQAEVLELRADPTINAEGVVIESHMDANRGPVASVLITQGTLKQGDHFVAGPAAGRARMLLNDFSQPVSEVRPGYPAEIIGFETVPRVGDQFNTVPDERVARAIAEKRRMRLRFRAESEAARAVSLDSLHEMVESGSLKDLNIILKADVQGSVEAIRQSIESITHEKVNLKIIHAAAGGVLESDVNLAMATGAVILAFNVRPTPGAAELAEKEKIEIRSYRIIYDLIEDVKAAIAGMLEPQYKEITLGRAEVKQVFKVSGVGNVAGCLVTEGEVVRGRKVRIVRNNAVAYEGEIISLRRVKDDVNKVSSGTECGIGFKNFNDIKVGDVIECFTLEEIPQQV